MKKAILAVSAGTTHAEAERSCIRPVEDALRAAFPGWEVHRAFTSRIIARRLRERGAIVESETEALARLTEEGYGEIVVAPTHIIPGGEYEKALAAAAGRRISAPLLADDADLDWMAALLAQIADEESRPLLLMGHGTDHVADEIYARLQQKLGEHIFIACTKGGRTLSGLLPRLRRLPGRTVTLMPLMLAAGSHAAKDLAGENDGSWKTILENEGFDVRVRMQGLGALDAVQRRFVEKVRRVL